MIENIEDDYELTDNCLIKKFHSNRVSMIYSNVVKALTIFLTITSLNAIGE